MYLAGVLLSGGDTFVFDILIVSPQKLALAGYCKQCPAIFLGRATLLRISKQVSGINK